MDLAAIQSALRERNIDAWLFYDHHHRDPIAYRVLGLPTTLMVTRRWFYLVPADGEPVKLVHKIEAGHLDSILSFSCALAWLIPRSRSPSLPSLNMSSPRRRPYFSAPIQSTLQCYYPHNFAALTMPLQIYLDFW